MFRDRRSTKQLKFTAFDWLVALACFLVYMTVLIQGELFKAGAVPKGGTPRTTREIFDEAYEVLRFHVGRITGRHRDPVAIGRATSSRDRERDQIREGGGGLGRD
jgi:hypothetical protein